MNYKSSRLIIFLFFLITAGACQTTWFTLSVLQPAENVLPASIHSISVIPMPGTASMAQADSKKMNSYAIRMGLIDGAYSKLSLSPRFSKVVLTDRSTAWFVHNQEIHWEDLSEVNRHDHTNCVLLLSKVVSDELVLSDTPEDAVNVSIIETRWLFCNPETQQTLARFEFTDTIIINASYQFVGKDDLFYGINFAAGEKCGERLAPFWIDVDRLIYKGPGRDLRDAARLAEDSKWRNAGLLWNDLTTYRKKKIASRAAYNLAFAFEREDDLDQAWLWLAYADSLRSTRLSSEYGKILQKRLKLRETINLQMAGN